MRVSPITSTYSMHRPMHSQKLTTNRVLQQPVEQEDNTIAFKGHLKFGDYVAGAICGTAMGVVATAVAGPVVGIAAGAFAAKAVANANNETRKNN